jgi:RHH-type proline utilization regulon transcriptional repressor/proline dehydrogenase/delta 1-pyrroline-5-carboxylate dehydrogenase
LPGPKTAIGIRLVKGAYWDFETVVAKQMGWEVPVVDEKARDRRGLRAPVHGDLRHCDIVYFQAPPRTTSGP